MYFTPGTTMDVDVWSLSANGAFKAKIQLLCFLEYRSSANYNEEVSIYRWNHKIILYNQTKNLTFRKK